MATIRQNHGVFQYTVGLTDSVESSFGFKIERLMSASENINDNEEENEYKEYFDYVIAGLTLEMPTNWEEALSIYQRILNITKEN